MRLFISVLFIVLLLATNLVQALEASKENIVTKSVSEPVTKQVSSSLHNPVGNEALAPDKITLNNTARSSADTDTVINDNLIILRTQNELIKSYHESLLNTVYWSLGTLVAAAALLVGFGWWTNFRMHETDKIRLKEEIQTMISDMESKISVELADNRTNYLELLDSRLENIRNNIDKEITSVKEDLSASVVRGQEVADDLSQLKTDVLKKIDVNSQDISLTDANLRVVEEHVWDLKGIPNNVLITQSQGIESYVAGGNYLMAGTILNRLNMTLAKLSKDTTFKIGEFAHDHIADTLEIVSKHHPIDTAETYEILNSIPKKQNKPSN